MARSKQGDYKDKIVKFKMLSFYLVNRTGRIWCAESLLLNTVHVLSKV